MANQDELKAMGINQNSNLKEENKKTNTVAQIIKALAIIQIVIGIMAVLFFYQFIEEWWIFIIIAILISAVFVYSLGEIIQLLQDIKNK